MELWPGQCIWLAAAFTRMNNRKIFHATCKKSLSFQNFTDSTTFYNQNKLFNQTIKVMPTAKKETPKKVVKKAAPAKKATTKKK
jgi:hypothetical protein